jgi:N-methyl-L-tryptophan oxidase
MAGTKMPSIKILMIISSHGDGRIIRAADPKRVYTIMGALSFKLWEELEKKTNSKLIQKTGILSFGPSDSPDLADIEVDVHNND